MMITLCRKSSFSASHRLHSKELSDEENKMIYGKCNRENGHGHNYKVTVVLRGQIDENTGMLMNLTDLDKIIDNAVTNVLDHRNIDKDVPYFFDKVSTTENLCIFIWNQLEMHMGSKSHLLHKVIVKETDKNKASYKKID